MERVRNRACRRCGARILDSLPVCPDCMDRYVAERMLDDLPTWPCDRHGRNVGIEDTPRRDRPE